MASGFGDSHLKVSPFGKELLHKNLGKKKGGRAQRQCGIVMGWVCRRLLERGGSLSLAAYTSFLVIKKGLNFRKMDSVVTQLWKYHFCFCSL